MPTLREMRTRTFIQSQIRDQWSEIVDRAVQGGLRPRLRDAALAALPKGKMNLATTSAKIAKGEAHGILTGIIYLAPAGEASSDWGSICPHSTAGCRAACLKFSGQMAMSPAQRARLWRTALLLGAPGLFWSLAVDHVTSLARSARKRGMTPAFRVNGTSDIATPASFRSFAEALGVKLYGYTKDVNRALHHLSSEVYSFTGSEESRAHAENVLRLGGRVSVVFDVARGEALPATWHGFPVVDGDETDAVFTRPRGVVLGLRLKGRNKAKQAARKSGFAQAPRRPDRPGPKALRTLLALS